MKPDKVVKKECRPKFWKDPEKYYATDVLGKEGFLRKICKKCNKPFWSTDEKRDVCGEPLCSGEGFGFIGNSPAKRKLDYVDVWLEFSKMFKKFGYTPIKRYPVAARWNPTMDYTNASISAFQPYVISGETEPPANPLVIPQFCLRFNDIDNVGITQSHNTGFVMIGQHMFVKPEDWDQSKVFRDIYSWLRKGLGLRGSDIIFQEDAWAGGGNFGPCMEFFSRGCELGNQVYMLYEQTPRGQSELGIKVLDMGMGQERNAWFSQGCETIYDATFPGVVKKLLSKTGIRIDKDLMKRYVPHAGILNLDEVDNVDKSWKTVAKRVGEDVKTLRDFIMPLSGLYSIGEHTRSLLVALADGSLPSNVGGGYNLRMLVRRIFYFRDKYGWDLDMAKVCEWHARYLRPMFPELSKNMESVNNILSVEEKKYRSTKRKSSFIVKKLLNEGVDEKKLLEVYDNQGIPPEMIKKEFKKQGRNIKIPDDFYSKVSELHEERGHSKETAEEGKMPLDDVEDTEILYHHDYRKNEFTAKVVKIIRNCVVLDKTAFYPTSGGQLHDTGRINGKEVRDVFRQGGKVIHVMEKSHGLREGERVRGEIDPQRRKKLSQQHTATHIINAAAREVLGKHVNQAGARKTETKSHLDLTHYQPITNEEIKKIEEKANLIVKKGIKIEKYELPRNEAEKRFGMRIYQGGAVPGKVIRVVNIKGVDTEACGGTHLNSTDEIGRIKILKTSRIQDGVSRVVFTAGERAGEVSKKEELLFKETVKLLNKFVKLDSDEGVSAGLRECSEFFSVPVGQVKSTVEKFTDEISEYGDIAGKMVKKRKVKSLKQACEIVFNMWKRMKKQSEKALEKEVRSETGDMIRKAKGKEIFEMVDKDRKGMIKLCESIISDRPDLTVILVNRDGFVVGMSQKEDIISKVKSLCEECGGSGGGKGELAQGKLNIKKLEKR